jgi:hypothetical protein
MSTLSHGVIAVVRDLIESETAFFRTAVAIPEPQRSRILANRSRMAQDILSLMRILVSPPAPQQRFVVNIPLDINAPEFEPVLVTPSATQIASAMETGAAPPVDGLCAICQEGFAVPCARLVRCGHYFHGGCITQWFSSSVRCPVCRDDVRVPQAEGPTGPSASVGGSRLFRG